jgi:hypothetical protein
MTTKKAPENFSLEKAKRTLQVSLGNKYNNERKKREIKKKKE